MKNTWMKVRRLIRYWIWWAVKYKISSTVNKKSHKVKNDEALKMKYKLQKFFNIQAMILTMIKRAECQLKSTLYLTHVMPLLLRISQRKNFHLLIRSPEKKEYRFRISLTSWRSHLLAIITHSFHWLCKDQGLNSFQC